MQQDLWDETLGLSSGASDMGRAIEQLPMNPIRGRGLLIRCARRAHAAYCRALVASRARAGFVTTIRSSSSPVSEICRSVNDAPSTSTVVNE